jgi:hypothetical protein
MLLDTILRPLEIFDASNGRHREMYATFVKHGSWGKCPVRFAVNDSQASNNNLAFAMQRKLVEYYIGKEFKLVAEKISNRV